MRIISQDKMSDVLYEQVSLISEETFFYKINCSEEIPLEVKAVFSDHIKARLGIYSSKEKVKSIIDNINDAYKRNEELYYMPDDESIKPNSL